MRLKIAGVNKNVRLAYLSTEYNCSVKLVGRLELQAEEAIWKKIWPDYELNQLLLEKKIKDTLIQEFSNYTQDIETYNRLRETSPYFPNDSGKYRPNYLLYADVITSSPGNPWYTDFKTLIREFQENPYHGFKVFELPMYTNNTYSMSFHPSKVWGIVPPSQVGRLLIPDLFNNTSAKESLENYIKNGSISHWPSADFQEFKKLLP